MPRKDMSKEEKKIETGGSSSSRQKRERGPEKPKSDMSRGRSRKK